MGGGFQAIKPAIVANTTNTMRLTMPQTMQTDKSSFQSQWFISNTPPFDTLLQRPGTA